MKDFGTINENKQKKQKKQKRNFHHTSPHADSTKAGKKVWEGSLFCFQGRSRDSCAVFGFQLASFRSAAAIFLSFIVSFMPMSLPGCGPALHIYASVPKIRMRAAQVRRSSATLHIPFHPFLSLFFFAAAAALEHMSAAERERERVCFPRSGKHLQTVLFSQLLPLWHQAFIPALSDGGRKSDLATSSHSSFSDRKWHQRWGSGVLFPPG